MVYGPDPAHHLLLYNLHMDHELRWFLHFFLNAWGKKSKEAYFMTCGNSMKFSALK